jgi:hypothetical protein
VKYILKDADGNQIGAELQYNGKTVQSKTEEIKRKRKGISFLNATIDADGYVHSKNESKSLKEKVVVGSIGSTSFNHGKSRPKQITVKLR